MNDQEKMVWQNHSRQWNLVGAPLKPSPQDGALMMELGTSCLGLSQTVKRIALLGVTPELIQLDWPQGVELDAFDNSEPMLQSVWAPNPKFASRVTLASWQALPVDDAHFDLVVGDGSFNALPSLVEYAPVFQELARISSAYTFPTLAQWRDCCQPLWRVDQVLYADYELAQRCPTLRFVRESFAT